jgi:hypothetical protein
MSCTKNYQTTIWMSCPCPEEHDTTTNCEDVRHVRHFCFPRSCVTVNKAINQARSDMLCSLGLPAILFSSKETVFFSHDKSTNNIFQPSFLAKRTWVFVCPHGLYTVSNRGIEPLIFIANGCVPLFLCYGCTHCPRSYECMTHLVSDTRSLNQQLPRGTHCPAKFHVCGHLFRFVLEILYSVDYSIIHSI